MTFGVKETKGVYIMSKQEIMAAIKSLAGSQGFYERLYEHLKEDENLLDYIAMQNIKDTVDLVMFLEGEW